MKTIPPIKLISNVRHLCKVKSLDQRAFLRRMYIEQEVGEKTARRVFRGDTNLRSIVIAKAAKVLGVGFGDIIRLG